MFKKKTTDPDVDYDTNFKVVIAPNSTENDQLRVHQSQTQLKSLESFSRSSESLTLPVTALVSSNQEKEKRKKKSRSATRSSIKDDSKSARVEDAVDYTVSRDQGESFMSEILRNVNKESKKIIGDCEEERLRIMNIRLESKLSRLYQENKSILNERVEIKSKLETVRQHFADTKSFAEGLEEDFESIKRERDFGKSKINELETSLSLRHAEMQSKIIDFEQITNELHEYQDNCLAANQKIRLVTEELNSRNDVVCDLKKKISEFHSQLELMKLYQENSEYRSEQLELELSAIKKARSWFEDQLNSVEGAKDRLQVEVHRVTNCLLDSNHENEIIRQKNRSVELRLAKFQEVKLHETTALLFELEQLQKEIMIGEEEKQQLEEQYTQIMRLYNGKIAELEALQEQNRYLKESSDELTMELDEVKAQYDAAQDNLRELEHEAKELRKNLAVAEDRFAQQSGFLEQAERDKDELERNVREMSGVSLEKDLVINGLKEELGNWRLSFDRVHAERDQACVGIERLREEIGQVEDQFELTRQSLASKEQIVKLAEDLNDDLKAKLALEAEECAARAETIGLLRADKNHLLDNCKQFQQNIIEILEELDTLRDNLNLANIRIAGLEDELSGMTMENAELNKTILHSRDEVDRFKTELAQAQERVERLGNVQGMYSKLLEDHRRLEEGYNELYGQHNMLNEEYQQVTGQLKAKLYEREEELERIVSIKEEIVAAAQKNLTMADQSHRELKNELENCRFNHTVELATKEELFREQLDKSAKEFSEMCQEKIRCETAIGSLQDHIKLLVDEYNRKLTECKSKMLHLQQQSTEYAEFENRSRSLMEELEQKKGEIEAILQVWKTLKQHTELVENELARRDAHIEHLVNNHEESLSKKENEIEELKEKLASLVDRSKAEENLKNNFIGQLEERVVVIDQLRKKADTYERERGELERNFSLLHTDLETVCRENELLKESQQQLAGELDRKTKDSRQLMSTNQNLLENIEHAVALKDAEKRAAFGWQQELELRANEVKLGDKRNEDLITGSKKAMEDLASIVKVRHQCVCVSMACIVCLVL